MIGQVFLFLSLLLGAVSVVDAITLSEAEEQHDQLNRATEAMIQARESTTIISLVGIIFTEMAVTTVTYSSGPKFTLHLRFARPQGDIESVEWQTTRLEQITTLLELLRAGQLKALVVQTKQGSFNGVKPCTHCDLRGWHYQPNVAPGGRP